MQAQREETNNPIKDMSDAAVLHREIEAQMLEFNFYMQKNNIAYPTRRYRACCPPDGSFGYGNGARCYDEVD